MKEIKKKLERTIALSSLFFVLISCLDSEIKPDPEVETLITNFVANGAVSVAEDGTIYVSEYGRFVDTGGSGTRVFEINSKGEVLDTIKGLSGPMGTAKDTKGNLFVNNANNTVNGQVLKITTTGEREVIATIDG